MSDKRKLGSPPAWTPPAVDTKLTPDKGDVFRDINAAHYSSFPMEPALRSLLALDPDFDVRGVDVIGCGSTLGNLLRFASNQPKPFRFDVDRVGDTVILVRREASPRELVTDVRGYGHRFPEKYTTWDADVGRSCSHQRIIQYEFGGLRFLLRSETDGYLKETSGAAADTPKNEISLSELFGSVSMGNIVPSQDQKLQLKRQGTMVPQDRIFDIKTRSDRNVLDMSEILPRLWMNQTPNFLLAYHQFGLFSRPEVKDVREDINKWWVHNTATLGIFHSVIKRIMDTVRDAGKQQMEVSWDGDGPLRITEQIGEGRRALPENMCSHWET